MCNRANLLPVNKCARTHVCEYICADSLHNNKYVLQIWNGCTQHNLPVGSHDVSLQAFPAFTFLLFNFMHTWPGTEASTQGDNPDHCQVVWV